MSNRLLRALRLTFLPALAWAALPALAAESELVLELVTDKAIALDGPAGGYYEALRAEPSTLGMAVAKLRRPERLAAGQPVQLALPDGAIVELEQPTIELRSAEDVSYGSPLRSGDGEALLVYQKGMLVGLVTQGTRVFRIDPLDASHHAVYEVDTSAFPREDVSMPDRPRLLAGPQVLSDALELHTSDPFGVARLAEKGINTATIKVYVAWTPAVATANANPAGLAQLAVDVTNTSFAASGVNPRVQLIGSSQVTYNEALANDDHLTDVNRFRGTSDGFMDNVHSLRDQFGADLMVLLINDPVVCGRADQIGAAANTAFATVHHTCAAGNFSLAHEIGHLAGCRHDNDNGTTPFAFGHGFSTAAGGGFRTIMAINPLTRPRIGRFSNPNILFNGVATGTAATNHCARVWNERAAAINAFRADPTIVASITAPTQVCTNQSVTVSATILPPPGCTVSACTYNWTNKRCENPPYGSCSSTYYPLSTTQSASTYFYPFTQYIDFRLTANCTLTCSGVSCPASRTWDIHVWGPASCY